MLFSRYQVADERECKILRNVAAIAGVEKSLFAAIDKVENRECDQSQIWTTCITSEKRVTMARRRSGAQ